MKKAEFHFRNPNAPKPNKPNHIGATLIVKHNCRILFERRVDSNRWALIGGGLKINESLEQCAIRELREETGIIMKEEEIKLIDIHSDPSRIVEYPDGNILRIVSVLYEVELKTLPELICSEESRELSWFDEDEIVSLDIVETHNHILEKYIKKN